MDTATILREHSSRVIGIVAAIALVLVAGAWFVNSAYAQGPNQNGWHNSMHNNQAVLDLLKTTESDLLTARQAGKRLLDIAAAQGVSEQALTDALLKPISENHAWITQNYPQSNVAQMTQYMRDWIAKAIRETKYGTMTDMRLFGGMGGGMINAGMMGNGHTGNGSGGGMGNSNANGFGGMMNGGGMVGRWNR